MPVLRRADAHPDAPPRRPVFANSDLGTPFLDVKAEPIVETPIGPILTTFDFVPTDSGGTRLRALCAADSKRGKLMAPIIRREMSARFGVGLTHMADLASAEAAGVDATAPPMPSLRPAAEQIAGAA